MCLILRETFHTLVHVWELTPNHISGGPLQSTYTSGSGECGFVDRAAWFKFQLGRMSLYLPICYLSRHHAVFGKPSSNCSYELCIKSIRVVGQLQPTNFRRGHMFAWSENSFWSYHSCPLLNLNHWLKQSGCSQLGIPK